MHEGRRAREFPGLHKGERNQTGSNKRGRRFGNFFAQAARIRFTSRSIVFLLIVFMRTATAVISTRCHRLGYGPDGFVLSALAGFIEENDYAMHVKTVRATYARRMGMTIDACRRHIKNAEALEPSGGFHLTLKFSDDFDEQHVAQMAERRGLVVTPLSLFYHQSPGSRGLVLGLGAIPDRNIESSICRLSEIIEEAGAIDRSYDLAS